MLHRLLTEHSHPVQLTAGVPGGPGWELLLQEGRQADFFMLGEAHGVGTIPMLTRHLTRLVPAGYGRLVIEVSPRSWKEEVELIRAAVAAVPNARSVLWGLDQEFVGSSESAFVRLGQIARTPEQRSIAEEFRQRAERGFAGMVGGKEPPLLASADSVAFAHLRRAFAGSPEALELVDELERSAEIYQLWQGRQVYRSNDLRKRLMKRNFMGYLGQLERQEANAPKMLFKFGAD